MTHELVQVARIVKPHGIRGEVVVDPLSDVPGRFAPGATLHDGRGRAFDVAGSRPHQGRLLVRFEGVTDRDAAELLRGVELFAEPGDYEASDTYYAHELVGLPVVTEDGDDLGTVRDLIELPASAGYDLLEVQRADGTTWLLPAVDEYVEVGVVEGEDTEVLVVVEPPAGLLDAGEGER